VVDPLLTQSLVHAQDARRRIDLLALDKSRRQNPVRLWESRAAFRVELVPVVYVTPPVNQDVLHLVEHSSWSGALLRG